MSAETDIYGVFIPTLLVWMLVAFFILAAMRAVLARVGFYRVVWHRSLFNFALYVIVLGGVVSLARWLQL
jgi:undecaprenyl pyrophosphate phosphatase UppP